MSTLRQVHIRMKTPPPCHVPGHGQVVAIQVNNVGAELLHLLKIEDSARDIVPHRRDHEGIGWKRRERGRHEIAIHGVVAPAGLPRMKSDAERERRHNRDRSQAWPGNARAQSLQKTSKPNPGGNRQQQIGFDAEPAEHSQQVRSWRRQVGQSRKGQAVEAEDEKKHDGRGAGWAILHAKIETRHSQDRTKPKKTRKRVSPHAPEGREERAVRDEDGLRTGPAHAESSIITAQDMGDQAGDAAFISPRNGRC
jgi:hypothetical protein